MGKTSILFQYTNAQDPSCQSPTIGIDFSKKVLYINDVEIHLRIWDTAGQIHNQAFPKSMYNGVVGAMIIYDVSNKVVV